jgi:hypothetical protein
MNRYKALLISLICLAGCNESRNTANQASPAPAAEASQSKVTLDAVRNELMKHNFGQASQLAEQLTAASPSVVEAWVVAAEAKAANQNRLAALAALEQAFNHGLREVSLIEQSRYLADIRNGEEYRTLLHRFGLRTHTTQAAVGDVSIVQGGGVTEVRAGDVSVKLPD